MILLSANDIARHTGGHVVSGSSNETFTGISTDSRNIKQGDLFIALTGEHYNGHRFVWDALSKGATGALVMDDIEHYRCTAISVKDTLYALGDIAAHIRNRFTPTVVGVTGSTGKTTIKEICASILSLRGRCLKTKKNYNNLIGTPLTLIDLEDGHEFAVIEMGTNTFGEIDRLSSITRPFISILANINPVHLNGLENISGIIKEKQAIFKNTADSGTAVINPYLPNIDEVEIPENLRVITFSDDKKADITLKGITYTGLDGSDIRIDIAGEIISAHVPLPGSHNIMNALAASACAYGLETDPKMIAEGITKAHFPGMRSEIIVSERLTIINDCYNANPESMKAALRMLVSTPHTYKAAVLGDMLELGKDQRHWHEELGKWVADSHINRLIFIGEMASVVADSAVNNGMDASSVTTSRTIDEIKPQLRDIYNRDAMVLVKASRSLHLDEVVTYLKEVA